MKPIIFITSLALLTAGCGDGSDKAAELTPDQKNMINQITVEGVREHVEVLGDDALEGREAGTRGYDMAADYVAGLYKDMGLKSFYGADNYFQNVPFMASRLNLDSAKISITHGNTKTALKLKDDFIMGAGFGDVNEAISAPLVFVGYGIDSPENNIDSFAGVDIAGKIVVALSGAPASLSADERAYYSRSKAETFIKKGAVGVLTIRSLTDQKRRDFKFYFTYLGDTSMHWVDSNGHAYDANSELKVTATLSQEGAEKLFANAPVTLESVLNDAEEGKTQSFDLNASATMSRTSVHENINSHNVVGYIEGSDPQLKDEYVVYGAHLDHIGIKPGKDGDNIYNGVYDNATGIGTILEIAEVMAKMDVKPKRSLIFVAFTGEEKGLRGSSYFVNNPPVNIDQLVANINIDMPILTFPAVDVMPLGAEHSTLYGAAERATQALGLKLTPDPMPEEVLFVRSDQYSFIKAGIPAIAYKSGITSADPQEDGMEMVKKFRSTYYHQPNDDLNLPFNKLGVENFARGAFLIGFNIANDDEKPHWIEGDFFAKKFARK